MPPLLAIPLILAVAAAAPAQKPKMIVLELQAAGGVEQEVAGAISEAITTHISDRGYFEVLGAREVGTLLTVERQRQLVGCADDESSCLTELAGGLGAQFVLSGTLARIGESFQLTLQTLDTVKAQPVGRATRIAPDLEALQAGLPWAVADATGMPAPPKPSNVASWSAVLAGALAAAGGGVVYLNAFSQEERLLQELQLGETRANVLKDAGYYRTEADRLQLQKQGGAVAVGVGAALVGLGILLYEGDPVASGGGGLSLVPTARGAALVGVFP